MTPSAEPPVRRKPRAKHTGDLKKLPEFQTEDQERKFWPTADSTQYLDGHRPLPASPASATRSPSNRSRKLPANISFTSATLPPSTPHSHPSPCYC